MKTKTKKDLIRAGEEIAAGKFWCICTVIDTDWQKTAEAKMFNPSTLVWWPVTDFDTSMSCKNARLLGIAFMITMPKELL